MVSAAGVARLRAHLERLYGAEAAAGAHERLLALIGDHVERHGPRRAREQPFDQSDVVLITYADQVTEPGRAPLQTLADVVERHAADFLTGVHVLPFYPSTSDDGFSVVDYDQVDPAVGDWPDVERLATTFRLMVDAVFNHVSASSPWFRGWLAGDPRYQDFFLAPGADVDLTAVTRPRTTPLLTRFPAAGGARDVWTTFSADQVDLNYANPEVLLRVTQSLLGYLTHGAGMVRLDAVAFLWKQVGTACVHLDHTHELIRFWRTLVDLVAPGTLLLTETNVPHAENVSYFGDGSDQAHLVYQFPLAPLVLSAFHLADTGVLAEWAASLTTPSPQTTFFNFLGSHDGVGLRPVEGLLTRAEVAQLGDLARAHGGGVSMRVEPDGRLSPYELNTVFFEALTPAGTREPLPVQVDRFLSAHAILLALAGVPAIYVQSLYGSGNWLEGVRQTGRLRSINRQKFDRRALERELADVGSRRFQVFSGLRRLIRLRTAEPAFHPNAGQRILPSVRAVFALERTAVDQSSTVVCLHNVSGRPQRYRERSLSVRGRLVDLATGEEHDVGATGMLEVDLAPYGVAWLRSAGGRIRS